MAEYIKRADAIAAIIAREAHGDGSEEYNIGLLRAMSAIDLIPAADVKPVVHGKWILTTTEHGKCSKCGAEVYLMDGLMHDYCSECGVKMDFEK